jgi:hypothetical protein
LVRQLACPNDVAITQPEGSPMDWTFLIGVGTIVLALAAAYQAWLLRNSAMADMLLKLEQRFNEKLLRTRRDAARSLKGQPDEHDAAIEDVLDFFETLGLLVRRRAMNTHVVWHTFFYWIHGYYRFATDFIKRQRSKFPHRYTDLEYLHKQTLQCEERRHGPLIEGEWDDFLDLEEVE